jgi:hypothetical protein
VIEAIEANPLLEAALALARAGWRVFPVYSIAKDGRCGCEHVGRCAYLRLHGSDKAKRQHADCPIGGPCKSCKPGKHPGTIHGHCDATSNEAQIRQWWAALPWNIGIAVPDGVVVVDIDPRNGGIETVAKICAAHGEAWARSFSVCSGGGGLQIYFTCEPGRRFPKTLDKHFGPGIDLKQHGGYVLAPPSNHKSGGGYRRDESAPNTIAPAPDWLLELSNAHTSRATNRRTDAPELTHVDDLPPPAGEIVEALGPHEKHEGRKFYLCGAIGGLMRKHGFTAAQCEATLRAWLPSDDLDVNVEHGLAWAVNAWRLPAEGVAGFAALSEILDAEHTQRIADASAAVSPNGRWVREWLERHANIVAREEASVAPLPAKQKRKTSRWAERVIERLLNQRRESTS